MSPRWALLLGLVACGDPEGADPADPVGTEPVALCAEGPVTTWDNFGSGFVVQHCQTCHASTTPDRHGAPESVTFDDEEQVWTWADRILARTTGPEPDMPPRGGVDDDDRYRVEVWLTCGG